MSTTRFQNFLSVLLFSGVLAGCDRAGDPKPPGSPGAVAINPNPPTATASAQTFNALKGRWQRADGEYVIEIRDVAPDGRLNAGYFNPQPINVSKATVSAEGGNIKIFIELRDVNYPGSTYTLVYAPGKDRLMGAYFQAVAQETYDVVFARSKP